jgi:PAS domain S-box-containing protein
VISLLWIFFSDRLLFLFKDNVSAPTFLLLNSGKGFFFVIATGLLLFFLIRKSTRQIASTQNEYRELYEANPSPMWIYDPVSLKFISVNETAINVYGYSRDEFLSITLKDIHPMEDHVKLIKAVNVVGNFQKSGVWRHIKKDGTILYADISSRRMHFRGKDAVMVLARDHTQVMAGRQALEKVNLDLAGERKRLIDIQELSKIAAWDYFIADKELVASDEVYQVFNIDRNLITASYDLFVKFVHREDLNAFLSAIRRTMIQGHDLDIVHRLFISKQDIRHLRLLGRVEVRDGKPYKIRGTLQDITEIKLLEQERNQINNENKMLDNIITKINNMVVIMDTQSRITWVNKAYEDFTGYKLADVIGLRPSAFMTGTDDYKVLDYIEEAESRLQFFAVDLVNYTRYNQAYWVNIEFTPMFEDGKFMGYITVHNNITTRKEKEEEINKQNSVLRNIAWLSSHEIRRPAASILGLMELIKTTDDPVEKEELLRLLNECTLQLDEIIHKINATIYEKLPAIE